MKLNLLKILSEEIKEQGFGRYYGGTTLPSGKKVEDIGGFDFSTNKIIDKPEISYSSDEDEDYGDVEDFDEELFDTEENRSGKLVQLSSTSYSNCKYDKDGTQNDYVNSLLVSDINDAAKSVGIIATITTAKSGHNKNVKGSKNVSRHMNGTGVDVAILNGIGSNISNLNYNNIDKSLFHNQESKDYLMIYSTPLNVQYSTLWYFILKNYPNLYLLNVKNYINIRKMYQYLKEILKYDKEKK
jgi:hypothetical protein